ncbi:MAG: hypothetical protein AB1347_05175 [Acidobacteriota bacterium]
MIAQAVAFVVLAAAGMPDTRGSLYLGYGAVAAVVLLYGAYLFARWRRIR